ncbi:hypothetical protein PAAG_08689 [Paracoccidioides lutzii Pb01]|uniref:Uncharacterized protein n=1 Tax=Paracoccidioides lutzii (strain ATCC MYA-826 / Pb01) TaxID=502779 RepID=C1HD48_PARBA|nr:hypothetical protein PAAG_08689 [Paracoccidioides lutzii Pb01]EEH39420.2 hypothetical protein PAAG_08689 [Paracoccidioides lutzii Pb01]
MFKLNDPRIRQKPSVEIAALKSTQPQYLARQSWHTYRDNASEFHPPSHHIISQMDELEDCEKTKLAPFSFTPDFFHSA